MLRKYTECFEYVLKYRVLGLEPKLHISSDSTQYVRILTVLSVSSTRSFNTCIKFIACLLSSDFSLSLSNVVGPCRVENFEYSSHECVASRRVGSRIWSFGR